MEESMNKQEAQEKALDMVRVKKSGVGIAARFGEEWRAHIHGERRYLETFYDLFSANEILTIRAHDGAKWEVYKDDSENIFPNYIEETGATDNMAARIAALMATIRDKD
jgi:hypothetical protein